MEETVGRVVDASEMREPSRMMKGRREGEKVED